MKNNKKNGKTVAAAVLAATCAMTNCAPAISTDYAVSGFDGDSGLKNAFQNGQWQYAADGTTVNISSGDKIIMEGNITSGETLEQAVSGITLDGGNYSLLKDASSTASTGLILGNGSIAIKDLTVSGFGTSIEATSGLTDGLTFEGTNVLTGALNSAANVTNAGNLTIGGGSNITGEYSTQGTGASLTIDGNDASSVKISDTATGNLTVNDGSTLNITSGSHVTTDLATKVGGNINVQNGATLDAGSNLTMESNGAIAVENGGELSYAAAQNGNISIESGAKLTVTNNATLEVNGSKTVDAGAIVTMDNGNITAATGGAIVLDGNSDNLQSGELGVSGGRLEISNTTFNDSLSLNASSGEIALNGVEFNSAYTVSDSLTTEINGDVAVGAGTLELNTGDTLNAGTISLGTADTGTISINGISTTDSVNINAEGGNVNLNNVTLANAADKIGANANVTITNGITQTAGEISLDSADSIAGALTQSGGTLNIADLSTDGTKSINSSAGSLNLDGVTLGGSDSIGANTSVKITNGLTQNAGTVNLNGNDSISGEYNISSGTTNADSLLNPAGTSGNIKVSGGTLNLSNTTTNDRLYVNAEGGEVSLNNITFGNSSDLIAEAVTATINGSVAVGAGTLELNTGDTLNAGTISLGTADTGTLSLNGISTNSNVNVSAEGGNVNLNNATLANAADKIGAGAVISVTNGLSQSKGDVTLNTGDSVSGEYQLTGGSLTLDGFATSGTGSINADGGSVTIKTGTAFNNSNDSIAKEVLTTINGDFAINEGSVTLNENDTLTTGTVTLGTNGTIEIINKATGNVNISAENGNVKLNNATLSNGDTISSNAVVTVTNGSTQTGGTVNLDNTGDTLNGEYHLTGGTLNLNGFSTDANGSINADGGEVTLGAGTTFNNSNDSIASAVKTIVNGNVNVKNGTIELNSNDSLTAGSLILANGDTGTIQIDGTGNFGTNENVNISAEGGNVKLLNNASINNASDLIAANANVTITNGITQTAGEINLDSADNSNIKGQIKLEGGTMNLDGVTTDSTKSIVATGGTIDLKNVKLANAADNIQAGATTSVSGDTEISNGSLTLDNATGDSWNSGNITLKNTGSLTLDGVAQGGNLDAQGGELTSNIDLTIGTGSQILDAVKVTLQGGKIDATAGGLVQLNGAAGKDDIQAGIIAVNDGELSLSNIKTNDNLSIDANSGKIVLSGVELNNASDSIKEDAGKTLEVTINGDVKLSAGELSLDASDNLTSGTISMGDTTGGTLNLTSVTTGPVKINADKGTVNLDSVTLNGGDNIDAGANVTVVNGVTVQKATLKLDGTDSVTGKIGLENNGDLTLADNFATGGNTYIDANGGTLRLNNVTLNHAQDEIIKNVHVIIDGTTTVNNGKLTLDSGDDMASGTIALGSASAGTGELTLSGISTKAGDPSTSGLNINAQKGSLILQNVTLNNANDIIAEAVATTVDGNVTINDGSLVLDAATDTLSKGTIKIGSVDPSKGSLIMKNVSTNDSTNVEINGGETIELDGITLANAKDKIADAANVTIKNGIKVQNGNVTLGGTGDTVAGEIAQTGGSITLNTLQTAAGTSNINSTGGSLTIKDAVLNNANDLIASDTTLTIQGPLEIKNGEVTVNAGDIWTDKISLTGGKLNYVNRTTNGTLDAQTGELNIGNGTDKTTLTLGADSAIKQAVNVTVNGDMVINGSTDVTIDNATDSLQSGSILLTDGKLTMDGPLSTENVSLKATGGELHLNNVELNNDNDDIKFNTHATINGPVKITKGNVELDIDDTLLTSDTITLDGETATLGVDGFSTADTTIDLKKGTLHIVNRGLTLNNASDIIQKEIRTIVDGNLTINEGKAYLNEDDAWNAGIITLNTNGKLQFENFSASASNVLVMDGDAQAELLNSTVGIAAAGNIKNGTMTLDDTSKINIGSGSYNLQNMNTSGTVNTINGGYQTHFAETMTVLNSPYTTLDGNTIDAGGQSRFSVDLYARASRVKQNSDVFKGTNLALSNADENGVITINDWSLNGRLTRKDAPIDRYFHFKLFDYENIDPNIVFNATDKEVFTPIGYYRLFGGENGNYTLALTKYNPQAFRGQVTTLAQYNNQLAFDDLVTSHVILHNESKLADIGSNRFAAATPTLGPYQYSQEDGGVWMKSYADLERLSMSQGIDVDNTAYGAVIGVDMPIVNLKNGWKFIPTPYIGYNGAHQTYSGVSAYQNGGQVGFMGTFMNGGYISSHTLYGGGYYNQMHVDGVTDETANWFWGTAHKFAYNWDIKRHFIFQPTFFMSYNMYGKQGFHSEFGDMGMRSGMLNGVNIAPGLNLIYLKKDWSVYAGIQYMYNINEQVSGRAGSVYIPNVSMRHGYVQYGLGGTKNIKDDLTSYAQVMFRNGGRTGVAFQLGLQYYYDLKETGAKLKRTWGRAVQAIRKY